MKRFVMVLAVVLTAGALTVAADGNGNPVAQVKGHGTAVMASTGPDVVFGVIDEGYPYPGNDFQVKGQVDAGGAASGTASFVFGAEFSAEWGADTIELTCAIQMGTVGEDGTVIFQGLAFEQDFFDGVVIFEEYTPFEIVVDAEGLFTLRWCSLPSFNLEITRGSLKIK